MVIEYELLRAADVVGFVSVVMVLVVENRDVVAPKKVEVANVDVVGKLLVVGEGEKPASFVIGIEVAVEVVAAEEVGKEVLVWKTATVVDVVAGGDLGVDMVVVMKVDLEVCKEAIV